MCDIRIFNLTNIQGAICICKQFLDSVKIKRKKEKKERKKEPSIIDYGNETNDYNQIINIK